MNRHEHEQAHQAELEPGYAEEVVDNFKQLYQLGADEYKLRHFGQPRLRSEPNEFRFIGPRSFDRDGLKVTQHPDWVLMLGHEQTPIPGHVECVMGVFDRSDLEKPLGAAQFVLDQDQDDVYGFEIIGQPIHWPSLLRGTITRVKEHNAELLRKAKEG